MTTYAPQIRALPDGKYEQTFDANYAAVEIADGAVTLAASDGEYGAIHGLVISSPEVEPFSAGDVYVEFNDQGNGCSGRDVQVSFDGSQLRVEYSDDVTVWVGRISYEPDADPLHDSDEESELPLRRVVVNLTIGADARAAFRNEIQRLQRNGMPIDLTASGNEARVFDGKPIIFFDGVCAMCNTFVNFALRIDRRETFLFAPLQGTTARELLPPLSEDPREWSMIYLDERGTHDQLDASLEVYRRLGGVWWLLSLMRYIPRPIRNRAYRVIARNRYRWFGKREHCRIPSERERRRFLP